MLLNRSIRVSLIIVVLSFIQPFSYGADPIITARQQIFQGGPNNGKPIDGSPLMTCPAGQTLSIDFGVTSWAYCFLYPTTTPTTTPTTETTTVTTTTPTTTPTTTTPTTTTPTTTSTPTSSETTTSTTRSDTTTSTTPATQPNTNRFAVEKSQIVYDNPCRFNVCNNSYSTDEESRIAYARQGKPIDGSALITCSPGYTLSIDYGRPSYAKCIDFRVNLDAPDNPWGTTQPTTSQTDTKTVTSQTDTKTVTTRTETSSQSETRTAQIAEVALISNSKERTVAAVELIKTFDSAEKEQSLDVTYKSKKSSVIDVDLAVPGIPVVITATKKGSPTITLKSTTDADGDAQIKTSKNLEGYSVALTVNKTKIDTDVVKKNK